MFDRWDDSIDTGSDTEYSLVLLALCVGVAFSFSRICLQFPSIAFGKGRFSYLSLRKYFLPTQTGFGFLFFNALSPPTVSLRL
jgi:hypothetical protein